MGFRVLGFRGLGFRVEGFRVKRNIDRGEKDPERPCNLPSCGTRLAGPSKLGAVLLHVGHRGLDT